MTQRDRCRRLEGQLDELVTVERPRLLAMMGAVDGNDPADQADRSGWEFELAHLDQRIRRLRDRLAQEDDGTGDDDLGVLAHGSTLVLDFGTGPETFLVSELDGGNSLEVITPNSPLGRALAGVAAGESVRYPTPGGYVTVKVVAIALRSPV